jgi:WD40 repeat protein
LQGHTALVNSVAISHDGRFIVTGSADRTAKIWNTQTGECAHTLQGHKGIIYSIAISHDGRFIVTGSGIQQKYGIFKPENVYIPCKDIKELFTR